jgi:hypothetical protein
MRFIKAADHRQTGIDEKAINKALSSEQGIGQADAAKNRFGGRRRRLPRQGDGQHEFHQA